MACETVAESHNTHSIYGFSHGCLCWRLRKANLDTAALCISFWGVSNGLFSRVKFVSDKIFRFLTCMWPPQATRSILCSDLVHNMVSQACVCVCVCVCARARARTHVNSVHLLDLRTLRCASHSTWDHGRILGEGSQTFTPTKFHLLESTCQFYDVKHFDVEVSFIWPAGIRPLRPVLA